MGWETVLSTVVQNILELAPYEMVHSYEQGVKFRWGELQRGRLTHKNGMRRPLPFFKAVINPLMYEVEKGEGKLGVINPKILLKDTPRTGMHWYWPIADEIELEETTLDTIRTSQQDVTHPSGRHFVFEGFIGYEVTNAVTFWRRLMGDEDFIRLRTEGKAFSHIFNCPENQIDEVRRYVHNRRESSSALAEAGKDDQDDQDLEGAINEEEMCPLEKNIVDSLDRLMTKPYGITPRVYNFLRFSETESRPKRIITDNGDVYVEESD